MAFIEALLLSIGLVFPLCANSQAAVTWQDATEYRSLSWDAETWPSVTHRAYDLADSTTLSHNGFEEIADSMGFAGCEILARVESGDSAFDAWMNSPGHRACIVNPAYTRAAVASFVGSDGLVYTAMWLR